MKILHCCLAAFYIDDYSYQENILPRIHQEFGHDVEIIASTETYLDNVSLDYTSAGSYLSNDGIKITRLPYVKWLPARLMRKLRLYTGLKRELERIQPDVIFLHDCQFLSINIITQYVHNTGAIVYVDCHTDLINSGRNFISRHILHGLIYKYCSHKILPVTKRFYATLPLRDEYLQKVYGIPKDKIKLLPFGVDDSRINDKDRISVRKKIRNQLGLTDKDTVFIAGGKIDHNKNIHILISSFLQVLDSNVKISAKLIIFGKPIDSLRPIIQNAANHPSIIYIGWLASEHIHQYLWASDVAMFPGTHSVLWEEAVGLGIPCVFRRWHGIEHVDLGGNCIFMDVIDEVHVVNILLSLINDPKKLDKMKKAASTLGPKIFSYTSIARRAIE